MRVCVEYFSSLLSKQTGLGVSMKFKLALIAAASAAGGMVKHAASAAQGAAAVSSALSDAADKAKDAISKP